MLSVIVTILLSGGFVAVSWLGYHFGRWLIRACLEQPELAPLPLSLPPTQPLNDAEREAVAMFNAAHEEYQRALNHYARAAENLLTAMRRLQSETRRSHW